MLATLQLAALPIAAPSMPSPPPAAMTQPSGTSCNALPTTDQLFDPPEIRSVDRVLKVTLYARIQGNPNDIQGICWWHGIPGHPVSDQDWVPPTHEDNGMVARIKVVP